MQLYDGIPQTLPFKQVENNNFFFYMLCLFALFACSFTLNCGIGETYNITVKENSFWYDGGIRVDANGYSSHFDSISNCYVGLGRCRPHLKKKRRVKTGNWMSLSCAIGQFVRPLTEIEAGKESTYRWMPLEEAELANTVFEVGKSTQFYSTHSGSAFKSFY